MIQAFDKLDSLKLESKDSKYFDKIDEYIEGIINGIYPFLFTIKTKNETKSFSYSDILTKNIVLKVDKTKYLH